MDKTKISIAASGNMTGAMCVAYLFRVFIGLSISVYTAMVN
jgi:hypothetical protein